MNEKLIEKKLKAGAKKMGCKALKFSSPFETGWPDRIVLLPGGKVKWAETKSTGKGLSPRQEVVHKELESLGHDVSIVDDQKSLDKFLNDLRNDSNV